MKPSLTARSLLAALLLAAGGSAGAADKSVAITQIVEHPSLEAIRQGVLDELAAQGLKPGQGLKLDYQNAQGNPATAAQIARKFAGDRPDAIVAITTPSAQAVAAATRDIPVVFVTVTDPIAARLVKSLERPGGNVTGTSDATPIAEQLALVRELTPQVRRLGVIYNPGEVNAVAQLERARAEGARFGLTVVESAAPKSSDVLGAARALVGKADAIYVPVDNTVVSALEAVVKVGLEAKLPVYSGDTDSVARGTLASLGYDYYASGRQSGRMLLRVLNGEAPGSMPVERIEKLELHLNLKTARVIGVELPAAVRGRAAKLID